MIAVSLDYDGGGERADRPDFETDINNVTAVAGPDWHQQRRFTRNEQSGRAPLPERTA